MVHELPTNAQFTGATHVRVKQKQVYGDEGKINIEVEYGTLDGNSDFQPRERTSNDVIVISDRSALKQRGVGGPPGNVGEAMQSATQEALNHLDENDLWPSIPSDS